MLSIGIVGLPNIGKSTLFQAITKKQVAIANFPFTTVDPNIGIAPVSDERLIKIGQVQKSKKIIPATVKFVDIAGLVKGAAEGLGLGNQFLSYIRETTAIVEVLRMFKNPEVANIEDEINPLRDLEIIGAELILADLETLGRIFTKIEHDIKAGDKAAQKNFEIIKLFEKTLQSGEWLGKLKLEKEENEMIKEYNFLTIKPVIILLNIDETVTKEEIEEITNRILKESGLTITGDNILAVDLATELIVSELSPEELKELNLSKNPISNSLDELIKRTYQILDLISFFTTTGEEETRGWPLKRNSTAWEAAGLIHSDFQEKFIKAEVANWKDFLAAGSWTKARETGKLKTEGRDYVVQDGDILYFKI